jgi:hypothetical protein
MREMRDERGEEGEMEENINRSKEEIQLKS